MPTSATTYYKLTIFNNGTDDATGVILTDTLPAGLVIVHGSGIQPTTHVGDVLTYDLGTVASVTSVQVLILVKSSEPGTFTNNASVSGIEGDPDPSNNTAAPLSITVTPVTTVPPSADVSVAASVAPSPATIGQDLTYTFTARTPAPTRPRTSR